MHPPPLLALIHSTADKLPTVRSVITHLRPWFSGHIS